MNIRHQDNSGRHLQVNGSELTAVMPQRATPKSKRNPGLRRSEASSLTWGDMQRWDDGSGRITVIRSKTDVEAAGAVVAITPAAMKALDAIRPVGVGGDVKVFGLSES